MCFSVYTRCCRNLFPKVNLIGIDKYKLLAVTSILPSVISTRLIFHSGVMKDLWRVNIIKYFRPKTFPVVCHVGEEEAVGRRVTTTLTSSGVGLKHHEVNCCHAFLCMSPWLEITIRAIFASWQIDLTYFTVQRYWWFLWSLINNTA